jgi:uncharacterized protein YbjT (DUF2867 family)
MNATQELGTATPLGTCPACGSTQLQTVTDGEYTNFLCERCARCWHIDLGHVSRVDPSSCPGCPRRGFCERRLPLDHDWAPSPSPASGTPIAIVGGGGHIGTAVAAQLAAFGHRVQIVEQGDRLDGLRDADAIVHLAGGLVPDRLHPFTNGNVDTVRAVLEAAGDPRGRRFVFASFPGADPHSPNGYLRAKGAAEALIQASDFAPVVFRTCHVFGSPERPGALVEHLLAHRSHPVTELGTGFQRWTPIYVADVAEALARAAVDPGAPTGTFELGGPQTMTVDDLVDRLNGRSVRKRHLDGVTARVASYVLPGLSPTMADLLTRDCVIHDNAAEHFGVALHPVSEVWPQGRVDAVEPWVPAIFPG